MKNQAIRYLAVLLLAGWLPGAGATTVLRAGIDQMLAGSELVFEGEVLSVTTRQTDGAGAIHTYVTFRVLDVIKGVPPDGTVELGFLGGSAGGRTLQVGGMRIPEVGEHGIYFVESLARRQVHPLFGWDQGHFLIGPDARGDAQVMTAGRRPVVRVDAPAAGPRAISDGVAGGVTLRTAAATADAPMTPAAFKQRLRELLGDRP